MVTVVDPSSLTTVFVVVESSVIVLPSLVVAVCVTVFVPSASVTVFSTEPFAPVLVVDVEISLPVLSTVVSLVTLLPSLKLYVFSVVLIPPVSVVLIVNVPSLAGTVDDAVLVTEPSAFSVVVSVLIVCPPLFL